MLLLSRNVVMVLFSWYCYCDVVVVYGYFGVVNICCYYGIVVVSNFVSVVVDMAVEVEVAGEKRM